MALILSIETSTKVCSVALHKGGVLVGIQEGFDANSHSETVLPFIHRILKKNGLLLKDLDAVAVSRGPGSYTGLRIGVSTAKGLAFGLDIPVVTVETLEALAMRGKEKYAEHGEHSDPNVLYVPMLDARRMEVYCAVFDHSGNWVEPVQACIIEDFSFKDKLDQGKMYFFGNGAEKCKGTIQHENAVFQGDDGIYTSAKEIGVLAYEKFQRKEFENVAYFEPYYLKEFLTKPSKKKLL